MELCRLSLRRKRRTEAFLVSSVPKGLLTDIPMTDLLEYRASQYFLKTKRKFKFHLFVFHLSEILSKMYWPLWKKCRFWNSVGFPGSSVGRESTCNAGDPDSIPGLRRSVGEGIGYPLQCSWASLVTDSKESTCNAGDLGSIPGLGRFPREGNGYPLQYSYLENSVDRGACRLQSIRLQSVRHDWATFTEILKASLIFHLAKMI